MHNINSGITKNDTVHQKSIFSCNVYKTNNQQKPQFINFRNPNKEPEVLFVNQKIFKTGKQVQECCTQTSKTILELAQKEDKTQLDADVQTSEILKKHTQLHESESVASGRKSLFKVCAPSSSRVFNHNSCWHNFGDGKNVRGLPILRARSPVDNRVTITRDRKGSPLKIGVQIQIYDDQLQNETQDIKECMSPDSLIGTPRERGNYSMEICPYSVASNISNFTLEGSCHEQDCLFNSSKRMGEKSLTQTFLEKKESRNDSLKSKSFIDSYQHPNYIQEPIETVKYKVPNSSKLKLHRRSSKSLELPDNSFERMKLSNFCTNSSFMYPTKASMIKSQMEEIKSTNSLIPPMRRGRSTSPKPTDNKLLESSRKIPYIDQSRSDVSSSTTLVNCTRHPEFLRLKDLELSKSECSVKLSDDVLSLMTNLGQSNSSCNENNITIALTKLQDEDWRVALRGLADLVEICRVVDVEVIYDYMNTINQRVISLLKSPRSHVCRTACQAAGHLFEYVKDTRRPVFDDIVDILLHKTADSNKFIRQDANMALDCMVTHISTFNAVRALCAKGPHHKNYLVRCATARLLVCSVVLAGADFILSPNSNEHTRRRIIVTMAGFLEDKNLDTRKLAERLYKVLSKDSRFDIYLRKYLEMEKILKIKKNLKLIHKK